MNESSMPTFYVLYRLIELQLRLNKSQINDVTMRYDYLVKTHIDKFSITFQFGYLI